MAVTDAEAIRELRLLIAHQLRRPPRDVDRAAVRAMVQSLRDVLEIGVTPLTEIRIRRWRRMAGLRVV
jgi:hypothetical protein